MKIVSRKIALTDAALQPPLTGKEVGEGFFNFDPADATSLPDVQDVYLKERFSFNSKYNKRFFDVEISRLMQQPRVLLISVVSCFYLVSTQPRKVFTFIPDV